ncbi:MAG: YeeE/YedE family protein [Thermoleophilaceae bacterium]
MIEGLLHRPPWFVLGALLGAVVLAGYALLNERVGVIGGFSDALERATGRRGALGWKAWFVLGVVGGGLLFRLLAGEPTVRHGFGWLTRELDGPLVAVVLVLAGVAIGYGAKMAGGCTSGNGLGGCSAGSPGSLTATGTFMGVAIALSFLIEAVT